MKQHTLTADFCRKYLNAAAALLLAAGLVLSAGCDGKKAVTPKDNASSSASSNTSDGSNPPEQTESTASEVNSAADRLAGTLTGETTVKKQRSDANEIRPAGNCASLLNPLKGYADDKAEKMRNGILATGNTEQYYKITGKKYYVSADGDNANSGLSPTEAIRSVDMVASLSLEEGDAVLFERSSVFRLTQTISPISGVIYGSYGSGDKPAIYASPKNYAEDNIWQPSLKKNVWKAEFSYKQAGSMVFDHGKEVGFLKIAGVDQLTSNTDFYHNADEGIIYLYCDKGNPSKVYKDIEICSEMRIFALANDVSNVTIDNLCLKYSGDCAVAGLEKNSDITVTNCEIGYIGGIEFGTVRYGNAITLWNGCGKFNVSNNWIYQSFDTAVSPQGSAGYEYTSITFTDNLLEYNNVDFEWYDHSASAKWRYIRCDGNLMRFTSLGWGTRPNDASYRGIEGCLRGATANFDFSGFSFKNNIMDCPGREVINWSMSSEQLAAFDMSGNTLYLNKTYRKIFNSNPAIMRNLNNAENTAKYFNKDVNSQTLEEIWRLWDKDSSSKAYCFD